MNIIHAVFSLWYPLTPRYSVSLGHQVRTVHDKIHWIIFDGYVESSITLLVMTVLIINIIYLNQPKLKIGVKIG